MLGNIEGRRRRRKEKMRWLFGSSKLWETVKDREAWHAAVHEVAESDTTEPPNKNNMRWMQVQGS